MLLKKCMSLDSKGIISVVKLANLYIIQKEYSKAEKLILDSEENDLLLEELATVYMKTGKEEEAHKIYNKLYDLSSENNIFNYNNRVIHIKKHEKNNLSKDIHGVFNYDAEMLLDYAMKNKKEKITRYTEDIYQIPYKNCGYQGGKYGDGHSYDYITLVLFPETENIITMFPSDKKFD